MPHDSLKPFRRPTKVPNKYGGSSVPQHLEAVAAAEGRVAVRIPFACVYCQRAFDLQRLPEKLVNIRHPFDIPAAIPEKRSICPLGQSARHALRALTTIGASGCRACQLSTLADQYAAKPSARWRTRITPLSRSTLRQFRPRNSLSLMPVKIAVMINRRRRGLELAARGQRQ